MPRRKITIEEAMEVLNNHGLDVHLTPKDESQEVQKLPDFVVEMPSETKPKSKSSPKGTTKITLFASHKLGCGGVKDEHGKPQGATVATFGPGVCEVPNELVAHLLHQDYLARQQDYESWENKEQKSYMVVSKVSSGQRSHGKVRADEIFEYGFDTVRAEQLGLVMRITE